MSAQQCLDTCQALYEKKITTYPRTDCRYLPEEQLADAPKILRALPIPEPVRGLMNASQKHAAWNNKKITAHNAIIPTGERVSGLSDMESRLFDLIWKSYVALFLPEYRYKALSALVELGGEAWKATGRQDLDQGSQKGLRGGKFFQCVQCVSVDQDGKGEQAEGGESHAEDSGFDSVESSVEVPGFPGERALDQNKSFGKCLPDREDLPNRCDRRVSPRFLRVGRSFPKESLEGPSEASDQAEVGRGPGK
jgi:hypothetical protein